MNQASFFPKLEIGCLGYYESCGNAKSVALSVFFYQVKRSQMPFTDSTQAGVLYFKLVTEFLLWYAYSILSNELLIIPQAVQQHIQCSGECFPIKVISNKNSHAGMPQRLLNVQMFEHESFK